MPAPPLRHVAVLAAIALAYAAAPSGTNAVETSSPSAVGAISAAAEWIDGAADPPRPDGVADFVGGIAARLHDADGTRLPGHLFVLMATAGSDASALLFDATPYTHDYGTAADTLESNRTAAVAIEAITGVDVEHLDLTTPPGGGSSTGIIYAIAYLNVVSDGAFTGDLRIAATGRLGPNGYIDPISAIDEKTAAASLADADVFFSPTTSTDDDTISFGARHVGELFRARNTGSALHEERRLDNYRMWGAERPDGLDIVGVRHIADVSAYLCGAGSLYACRILDILDGKVIRTQIHRVETASLPRRSSTMDAHIANGAGFLAPSSVRLHTGQHIQQQGANRCEFIQHCRLPVGVADGHLRSVSRSWRRSGRSASRSMPTAVVTRRDNKPR